MAHIVTALLMKYEWLQEAVEEAPTTTATSKKGEGSRRCLEVYIQYQGRSSEGWDESSRNCSELEEERILLHDLPTGRAHNHWPPLHSRQPAIPLCHPSSPTPSIHPMAPSPSNDIPVALSTFAPFASSNSFGAPPIKQTDHPPCTNAPRLLAQSGHGKLSKPSNRLSRRYIGFHRPTSSH
ncbi:hypothetical protein CPC08DRAFT_219945 [Agrocybe pediades]|nr:hypothetical protein CPC08DRAFT_219945 [Agrocybe pediades]